MPPTATLSEERTVGRFSAHPRRRSLPPAHRMHRSTVRHTTLISRRPPSRSIWPVEPRIRRGPVRSPPRRRGPARSNRSVVAPSVVEAALPVRLARVGIAGVQVAPTWLEVVRFGAAAVAGCRRPEALRPRARRPSPYRLTEGRLHRSPPLPGAPEPNTAGGPWRLSRELVWQLESCHGRFDFPVRGNSGAFAARIRMLTSARNSIVDRSSRPRCWSPALSLFSSSVSRRSTCSSFARWSGRVLICWWTSTNPVEITLRRSDDLRGYGILHGGKVVHAPLIAGIGREKPCREAAHDSAGGHQGTDVNLRVEFQSVQLITMNL